ncbi:MAG: LysR family transcriptional regulator [Pararhodobacter sp.]|nr:LysR family transcriptional regulator [Pararhodobacter sp.]
MNLSCLDLNLLRVLDALLRERSTVRAGDRLGLSQPAVSAALGRLRHALSDPLLVRQGQGLVPTSYAQSLETPLRQALQALEGLLNGPAVFDPGTAQFDFRISGTDFFSTMLIPALIGRIEKCAPGIRLQLVDLVPDNYVETLDRYEVDLGLIPLQTFPAWLEHERLFQASFVAIARSGHPRLNEVPPGATMPLDLFCDLRHVLCSPEGKLHGLGDVALAKQGLSRRIAITVPVFDGVFNVVSNSDLIALVPEVLALHLAPRGGFEIYAPPIPVDAPHLCMIWHRRMTADPAHRWLRGEVAQLLKPLDASLLSASKPN